jgi:hypothetical protein
VVKRLLLRAIVSLLCFLFGAFANCASGMGSNLLAGAPMAGAMTLFFLPILLVAFPVVVGLGFGLRAIIEVYGKRRLPARTIFPWSLPVVLGLVGAAPAVWYYSPATVYHGFVGDPVPKSLADFHYWWQQVPGDDEYILRFKIDPKEFDGILSHHHFEKTIGAEQVRAALDKEDCALGDYRRSPGAFFSLPAEPLVQMYRFYADDNGLPRIMNVYTNAARDTVVVFGDN